VAADDPRDGQGAQRVDRAVAVRRRRGIEAPGQNPDVADLG
jgi:hypothetical protein